MARPFTFVRVFFRLLVVVSVVGAIAGSGFWWMKYRPVHANETTTINSALPRIDWDPRLPDVLRLPSDYAKSLKVKTAYVQPAPPPEPLRLRGSLMFDVNRLARVGCLFSGQVISLGKADKTKRRRLAHLAPASLVEKQTDDPDTLRPGDFVRKGQLLAVVWSQTVGDKKSDLVDALSKLDTDKRVLDRLLAVGNKVIKENDIESARQAVFLDHNAVERAKRTLESWHLSAPEIEAVYKEAQRIQERHRDKRSSPDKPVLAPSGDPEALHWAETAIRAPLDGVLLEKNVNIGDLVDSTTNLFKIVDLSNLQVMADAYEEDLASLRRLKPEQLRWKIHFTGARNAKPIAGEIERIVPIVDPTQHTGLVTGWLPNDGGDRLIGEFIAAAVDLPPDPTLVAIPAAALIEEGDSATVLAAADGSRLAFAPRKVAVVQRGRETVLVRAQPTEAEQRRGAQPLHEGEEVVTIGNLQLAAELANFKASPSVRR